MGNRQRLNDSELQALLRSAQDQQAPATLRAHGSHRMLGDLQLRAVEPGQALHIAGAKRRDQLPEAGTPMTLTLLLGDDVVSIDAPFLTPLEVEGEAAPLLRVGWPAEGIQRHPRRQIRVAAPQQTPLAAQVRLGKQVYGGLLLNLTEAGLGLAVQEVLTLEFHTLIQIDTKLPDGSGFTCEGEVRHFTHLEEDTYPTRFGISILKASEADLEKLRTFIQVRRTDRSESLRHTDH
ncbi:MAG TPA: PilZ domain-containing protein [Holophagaceae bacterium]|nr:PilZ domain-containing protein [Holophagaceae bacterium]